MKGRRRQGRQRKRWEDNIREWTGLDFAKDSKEQRKMEGTGYEVVCGAPSDPRGLGIDESEGIWPGGLTVCQCGSSSV